MTLRVEVADQVMTLRLDRPEAFNAFDEDMARGFVQAMADAAADDAVRVVVVTGTGAAFSAGAELTGDDPVTGFDEQTMAGAAALVRSVTTLSKPVVAGVGGIAAGVGASLCFAADLAVVRESAAFVFAFAAVGLMPDGGATLTVAASAGRARAMRWALLGESLSAQEAHDAGLVSHVAPDAAYDQTLAAVVRRLAAGAPAAQAATKRAVNAATIGDLDAALDRETRGQLALFGTRDAAEGMRAFVQRRRPDFTGD